MKIIRFLSLVFLVTIISLFSGFVLSYSAKEPLDSQYQPPGITLENFKEPPEKARSSDVFGFADIAWKTFVTLNWPTNYEGRPLEKFTFGEAPLAPRVWEFYRTPGEVFLPNAENPLLNTRNPFATRTLKLDLNEAKGSGLLETSKMQENLQKSRALIKEINASGKCPVEMGPSQAKNDVFFNNIPLVDRRGNYVIIETHLNQNEFNQIVDNEWYNASKLAEYDDEKNRFQFKSTTARTDAPIEIKAAWRVFDQDSKSEEKNRYYTTKRVLEIPKKRFCSNDSCPDASAQNISSPDDTVLREIEVGLIGFHIAYKIPKQQGLTPGWVWATFEQVDNLEVIKPPEVVGLKPTLSNPDCNSNMENCESNYPYVEWPFLWRDESPHAVTQTKSPNGKIIPKAQIPTQVVRLSEQPKCRNSYLADDIKENLKEQNENWQRAFHTVVPNSVWQYYQLVGTQWMQSPNIVNEKPPSNNQVPPISHRDWLISKITQSIRPGALVNVSMEAYSQNQINGDSCIGCHVHAKLPNSRGNPPKVLSDFSFLLEEAAGSASPR
jgi:hypothetical protein